MKLRPRFTCPGVVLIVTAVRTGYLIVPRWSVGTIRSNLILNPIYNRRIQWLINYDPLRAGATQVVQNYSRTSLATRS